MTLNTRCCRCCFCLQRHLLTPRVFHANGHRDSQMGTCWGRLPTSVHLLDIDGVDPCGVVVWTQLISQVCSLHFGFFDPSSCVFFLNITYSVLVSLTVQYKHCSKLPLCCCQWSLDTNMHVVISILKKSPKRC